MPATADKLLPTSLDILRSALTRGLTGRLSRAEGRMPSREVFVMQGQILAAHGPEDGPWVIRRLVNSGALTERQGKAFIRRLTRGIPFDELILGHVPDGLLEELMIGRFRQNLLDFLSSPPPIEFQAMDTMFVANIQSGHDTRQTLQAIVDLRERIGPLMRHRGPLTLGLGPGMPSTRQEARITDLCDPPISLRDLLTYSPFETGETLDCVMQMLASGGLISQERVLLQRPRGSGPTTDYAVEELFTVDGPPIPESAGVPAAPIAPEHLALLREDAEAPSPTDFGEVPQAFQTEQDDGRDFELPQISSSHLVLVQDAEPPALEPAPFPASAEPPTPVQVVDEPSSTVEGTVRLHAETDLFDPISSTAPIAKDGDLLQDGGLLEETGDELRRTPLLTPESAPRSPHSLPPKDSVFDGPVLAGVAATPSLPPDQDSVPESWRDLSALGFEQHARRPHRATPAHEASSPAPSTAEPFASVLDHPKADSSATESVAPAPDLATETDAITAAPEIPEALRVQQPEVPPSIEATTRTSGSMVSIRDGPEDLPEPRSAVERSTVESAPPVPSSTSVHRPMPVLEGYDATDVVEPQLAGMVRPPASPSAHAQEAPANSAPTGSEPPPVEAPADELPPFSDEPSEDDPTLEADKPFFMDSSDDAVLFGDDPLTEEMPPRETPHRNDTAASPSDDSDDSNDSDNALVDAARRYLEAANARQKTQSPKTHSVAPAYNPNPVLGTEESAKPVERKFTGFDFDVDDSEMAMFEDHDHFRGRGEGQFTLNKNLLDKVELLPTRKPDRVRMQQPEALPPHDSIIEMGEATPEEEADAGVVALAFSAPTLDADQIFYKISVGGDVARVIAGHFDATVGPGAGQTNIQLLVDAAASPFARLFQQVRVSADGSLDEEKIFENLQQRPASEQRSLLDRGMRNFIERALSTAAEELSDEALDTVLNEIAGYQQRLRM